MEEGFVGRHLLVDFEVKVVEQLYKVDVVYELLEQLSTKLNMTLIHPPIVARLPFANNELDRFTNNLIAEGIDSISINNMKELLQARKTVESGVSGVAVWLESHSSIHTWPEKNFVSFDAYSCKDFDTTVALNLLKDIFDISSINGLNVARYFNRPQVVEQLR